MIRHLSLAVMLMLGAAGGAASAQNPGGTAGTAIPGTKVEQLPPTRDLLTDPRIGEEGKLPLKVEVRPASAMTEEDKDLETSAKTRIGQDAALYDLGFGEGDWQESQLVCPAFPQHLLLRFTRNLGAGDLSMFAVSVPRGKEGRVRVIPILRRGYSVITPAPESKVTIAVFNRIRAEEQTGAKGWSAVSVCYAALTSERWKEPREVTTLEMVGSQTLELVEHGGLDVALEMADPAPGRWAISYDRAGAVVKAEYTPFGDLTWRQLPATATELKGTPLPAPVDQLMGKPTPAPVSDQTGRPIPGGPEPQGKPLPPPTDSPNKPQ